MNHVPKHTDRKLDKDHEPILRLDPTLLPAKGSKYDGPFPGNVCATCGATLEIVKVR